MDDNVAKIDHDPAMLRATFAPAVQPVGVPGSIHHRVGQGIQHAIAGTVRQDKIICK